MKRLPRRSPSSSWRRSQESLLVCLLKKKRIRFLKLIERYFIFIMLNNIIRKDVSMRSIGILNKRSVFFIKVILIFMAFSGCQKSCERGYKPPSTLIDQNAENPPVEKDLAYYQNFLKTNWDTLKDKIRDILFYRR